MITVSRKDVLHEELMQFDERKFIKLIIICFIGTTIIWLLLEKVLGIYMRPFPYLIQTLVS